MTMAINTIENNKRYEERTRMTKVSVLDRAPFERACAYSPLDTPFSGPILKLLKKSNIIILFYYRFPIRLELAC